MNPNTDIITLAGLASVSQTMDAVENAVTAHGITIYARIDQQAEAIKAGLNLNPMQLLIFGNPKAGVLLMQANPVCGLDLPLKVLVWEDDKHKVWLSYNSFDYLQKRFDLPLAGIQNLTGIEKIIRQALST